MMKKKVQLPFFIALVCTLIFGVAACNNEKEVSFETKVQEEDFATFEIPKEDRKSVV